MSKCPICSQPIKQESIQYDGGQISEEYYRCTNCHQYSTSFAYGHISYTVGNKRFDWDYNTPDKEMEILAKALSKAIKEERKDYQNSLPIGHA